MATPYSLQVYEEVTSTQDLALASFTADPLLVVAARQNAGRGRVGRSWMHAQRAVAASLAVRPSWPAATWTTLPLVAGLAAVDALGAGIGLKWPNDLLLAGRKLGGILVESSGDFVVVGLGVNLWWPEAPEVAAALSNDDPGPDRAIAIAENWATGLLSRLGSEPGDWGRVEYVARCLTVGEEITWLPDGQGIAVGVDADGALIVDTERGLERLVAGEISHVRLA